MSKQVRVGFIGTGGIATEMHMPALHAIGGVEIAALFDMHAQSAQAAAERFGGRVYESQQALLEQADIDALYVCLPPASHTDAEIIAAGKGIHLFIEKPVVISMEKGKEIATAIEQAGVISCAGYQLRYWPAVRAAKAFVQDKAIALVAGHRWDGIPGGPGHWWRVMDMSGGMVHEMATHQIDVMRFVAGEVARVHAVNSRNVLKDVENLTVPDAQALLLEFRNGATGCFSASCALTQGGGSSGLEFLLRDVRVSLQLPEVHILPEGTADITLPPAGLDIDAAFIHAIRTGDRSVILSDYRDALKTAEVTLGANESARTSQPVTMTLN